uniref:TOG domain-containing protein n=1 Tax=Ciona savignyi TaxID=51511 RepID=H2ZPR4_CIOSA
MKLDEKLCSTGSEEGVVLLGEVIVRVIKQLGDLAPHVAKTLIPLFLRSSRDQRSSVRASCFSNLAELCPLLRHTLSSFQYELAECLCATASSDTDATVRSGSVYVMFRIFEAFQYEILEMLPDTIGRYYSTLKKVVESDVNEVTTRHARLALDRIADAMKGIMFPNPDKYQKQHKITILPQQ